jgi:hypothetical protein
LHFPHCIDDNRTRFGRATLVIKESNTLIYNRIKLRQKQKYRFKEEVKIYKVSFFFKYFLECIDVCCSGLAGIFSAHLTKDKHHHG